MLKPRDAFPLLVFTLLLSKAYCAPQAATPPAPSQGAPGAELPAVLGERKTANLIVKLSANPNPPIRGLGTLEAIVTDAAGKPVTEAQVSFDLDMIAMSHGKNVVTALSQGQGRYLGRVRYMMPGTWKAIVRIERPGQAAEDLRFDFNVKFW
jgi:hypothetical protein